LWNQELLRLLKFVRANLKKCQMKFCDPIDVGVVGIDEADSLFKAAESFEIVFGFKLRKSKKTSRCAELRRKLGHFPQSRNGLGKSVGVVQKGAEIPPTLCPLLGTDLNGLLVQTDRSITIPVFACFACGLAESREVRLVLRRQNKWNREAE
jgi:hypothetical protein